MGLGLIILSVAVELAELASGCKFWELQLQAGHRQWRGEEEARKDCGDAPFRYFQDRQ